MSLQQAVAKGHLTNRCSKVSSTPELHISHSYESSTIVLCLRIFLVLRRFLSNNQKKKFVLVMAA